MQRDLLVLVVAVTLLFASSLSLVTANHRSRTLFVDLDVAAADNKALVADESRLRIELGKLAQPAAIESAARRFGMRDPPAAATVFLPVPHAAARAGEPAR